MPATATENPAGQLEKAKLLALSWQTPKSLKLFSRMFGIL